MQIAHFWVEETTYATRLLTWLLPCLRQEKSLHVVELCDVMHGDSKKYGLMKNDRPLCSFSECILNAGMYILFQNDVIQNCQIDHNFSFVN